MVFFNFFEFFCYFFGIFYYALGRNETERQDLFSFFPGLFQLILALNEFMLTFFNLLNFFAIFLEFLIMRQEGTKRNDNSYFLSFFTFSKLFWLEMMPWCYFLFFFYFFAIFLKFSIMRQVGTEQNDNFYFLHFSSSFNLWWLEMER